MSASKLPCHRATRHLPPAVGVPKDLVNVHSASARDVLCLPFVAGCSYGPEGNSRWLWTDSTSDLRDEPSCVFFFPSSFVGNRQTVGKEAEDHTEGKVMMLHSLGKPYSPDGLLDG